MKVNSSPQSVARSEQEAPAEKQGGCQEPDPGGVSSGQSEGWGEYRAARREEENVFFFTFKACSNTTESKLIIIHLFKWDHMHPHYFKNLENTANIWKILENLGQGTPENTFLLLFRSLNSTLAKMLVLKWRVYK